MPSKSGWILGSAVFFGSLIYFGLGVADEPFFADESAYFSQTYYYRLLTSGRWNHSDWIHPAAYDYMPIPKYLMGAALTAAGYGGKIPTSTQAWEWWMSGHFDPPGDPDVLPPLRWQSAIWAALGCAAALTLGWQLLGPKTGLTAAFLLAASPLYSVHARRAMPDDLVQTFVVACLCFSIAAVRRPGAGVGSLRRFGLLVLAAGVAGGFAPATKLNGAVGLLAVAFLAVACLLQPLQALSWKAIGVLALVGLIGLASFATVNPYFFVKPAMPAPDAPAESANVVAGRRRTPEAVEELRRVAVMSPIERVRHMLRHRTEGLAESIDRFPHDALRTPTDRLHAIVTTGLGRFSAAGRLPLPWDVDGWIMAALVAGGLWSALRAGWRESRRGQPPVSWVLVFWPAVEVATLLPNLTLNWDRYYLGVVAWSSVLAAYAVGSSANGVLQRLTLAPPAPPPDGPKETP